MCQLFGELRLNLNCIETTTTTVEHCPVENYSMESELYELMYNLLILIDVDFYWIKNAGWLNCYNWTGWITSHELWV